MKNTRLEGGRPESFRKRFIFWISIIFDLLSVPLGSGWVAIGSGCMIRLGGIRIGFNGVDCNSIALG